VHKEVFLKFYKIIIGEDMGTKEEGMEGWADSLDLFMILFAFFKS
jgi:hypothetical protein